MNEIYVDIGKFEISHNPSILTSLGLGSCVAVTLYDKASHLGGLAHVMLPDSRDAMKNSRMTKYADIAIKEMVKALEAKGCKVQNMIAKLAGGAQMFAAFDASQAHTPIVQIGKRNVAMAKQVLQELKIPIEAEDTGGTTGRTVRFDLTTGILHIHTKDGEKEI